MRQKFAIQADPRVSPVSWRSAMQNVQLIRAIEFHLGFLRTNDAPQGIGRVNDASTLIFRPDVESSVTGKTVAEQGVGAGVAGCPISFRDADCFLPHRPGISYLKNFCLRIKKFAQVGKINVSPDTVGAEIVDGVKWGEINLLRDRFARWNIQRHFTFFKGNGRDRLAFASRDLKTEPSLSFAVVKIDTASSEIGNGKFRHDRLVGDVLQPRQFQIDLNLCARRYRKKKGR